MRGVQRPVEGLRRCVIGSIDGDGKAWRVGSDRHALRRGAVETLDAIYIGRGVTREIDSGIPGGNGSNHRPAVARKSERDVMHHRAVIIEPENLIIVGQLIEIRLRSLDHIGVTDRHEVVAVRTRMLVI